MALPILDEARELIWTSEQTLKDVFTRADAIETVTQQRVLEAFQEEYVSARHFTPSNGYGYDDIGRDTLDRVFARSLQAEAALVRPHIVNGTHAIYLAVAGVTKPGDTVLSITGDPYDTLEQAFGLRGEAPGSLKSLGIDFQTIPLKEDRIDLEAAQKAISADSSIRIIFIQRSRGYSWRNAIDVASMGEAVKALRAIRKDLIFIADNCYGEFTAAMEPTALGVDLIAGSLIKNPGGGLAPTGGYIAGKAHLIDLVAQRLTIPGLGGEVGSYEATYRPFYQGLFLAPHTVNQCIKTAALFARVFSSMGYKTLPEASDVRSDIIQAIQFGTAEELRAFCTAIQQAAPIDSFVVPEEWDMPGYADQVIMAAGAFVQGATTELSADGPMKPPYTAYLQGSLTYSHGRLAAMMAASKLLSKGA